MKALQVFVNRILRGLYQLWTRDIWHLQPSAPLNWRYFLPSQSSKICLHRTLWWNSRYKLPGLLWLPLELYRWAYWRNIHAPRLLNDAVAHFGKSVELRFGIDIAMQESRIAYWAKTWCISPYNAYYWQLFQPNTNGLNIIYDNQTSAFHFIQNLKTGATKADHRLLGDKIALAKYLSVQGIPMVETACETRGEWQDLEITLDGHPKLFCKLRSGNQGESAFTVWRCESGMQGLAHDGKNLSDEASVRLAWQQINDKGDVLLQPLLVNHPLLAPASPADVAITLRIVTAIQSKGSSAWWAELQVPGDVPAMGSRGFWRFPISANNGQILKLDSEKFLRQDWQDEYDAIWQRLANAAFVPFWNQICSDSLKAHQSLPKLWAVAWDWVITPEGPVMLEGNGGWGLYEIQQRESLVV